MAVGHAYETQSYTTSTVLREVERWLDAAGLGLTFIDRIDPDEAPTPLQHKGVHIDLPSGENTDTFRGRTADMDEETLTVRLVYRASPKDQKASMYEAYDLADKVRYRLTDWHAWRAEWNVKYRSAARGRHPASAEWFVIEHTYTLRREAALGG